MSSITKAFVFAVAGSTAALLLASQAHAQRSGVICTEGHMYDPDRTEGEDATPAPGLYLTTISKARAGCTAFQTKLGGTAVFNWGTSFGEIHAMETRTTWEASVEDTDIVYTVGHGYSGNTSAGHELSAYRINDRLQSKRVRLGNNGRGLRILSIWSCDSLTPYAVPDEGALGAPFPSSYKFEEPVAEDVWSRWQKAMSGGLKIITGSWQVMWINRMDVMGSNYGQYLKNGSTIAESWRRASFDSDTRNTPMILATGTNQNDCTNRLYNMTMANSTDASFPKLRDAAIGQSCWHAWW